MFVPLAALCDPACSPARLALAVGHSAERAGALIAQNNSESLRLCHSEAWPPHLSHNVSMSAVRPRAAASCSINIMHPAVETTLKGSGYLQPAECVRMSATCRALGGFSSREAVTAKQLLQHAASLVQAHKHSQHQDQPAQQTRHEPLLEGLRPQLHYDYVVQAAAQLDMQGVDQLVAALLFNTANVPLLSAALLVAAGLWVGSPQMAAAAARGIEGHEVWYIAHQWLMAVDALRRLHDTPLLLCFLEPGPLKWLQNPDQYTIVTMCAEAEELSASQLETLIHLALRLQAQPLYQVEPSKRCYRIAMPSTAFSQVWAGLRRPWHAEAAGRRLDSEAVERLLLTAVSVACSPALDVHQPGVALITQGARAIRVAEDHNVQVFRSVDDREGWQGFGSIVGCLCVLPAARYMENSSFEKIWLSLAQGLDEVGEIESFACCCLPQVCWRRWQYTGELCRLGDAYGGMHFLSQPQMVASLLRYKITTGSIGDVMHIQSLAAQAVSAGSIQQVTQPALCSLIDAAKVEYMPGVHDDLLVGMYSVQGLQSLLWYARLSQAAWRSVQYRLPPNVVVDMCERIVAEGLESYLPQQQIAKLAGMLHQTFLVPLLQRSGWRGWYVRFAEASVIVGYSHVPGTLDHLLWVSKLCCWLK